MCCLRGIPFFWRLPLRRQKRQRTSLLHEQREGATKKPLFSSMLLKKCFAAVEDRLIYFLMFYGNKFAMIVHVGNSCQALLQGKKNSPELAPSRIVSSCTFAKLLCLKKAFLCSNFWHQRLHPMILLDFYSDQPSVV